MSPWPQMITEDLVRLDADLGADKHDVIRALGRHRRRRGAGHRRRPARRGRARPRGDVGHRASTAASRSRTAAPPASRPRRSPSPGSSPRVDFGAKDGPADLAFLIAAPAGGDASHLQLLDQAGAAAGQDGVHRRLRAATSPGRGRRPGQRRRRRRAPGRAGGRRAPQPQPRPPRRVAAGAVRWSPSPPARPASRTPTWPPRPSRPPPRGPGSTIQVETQGSAGSTPLPRDDHRRGRRRDLRRRRGGPRPRPVRRQARRLVGRQAPDRATATR